MSRELARASYREISRRFVPRSGITKGFAKNLVRLEYGDIPSDVVGIAKIAILDAVGCMVAGALQGSSRRVLRYVRSLGGAPDATCVYYGDRTNIYNAALVNGTFCHGARESVVIPAALAVAEKEIANGHEVTTAVVAGWEAMCRLAAAAPTVPTERPLNPISTFGPFGAAVAAGKILRLGDFDMENTLTCCTAQAAGTMQSAQTGGESERLVSGFAASYGLKAASMARQGVSGARDILEGKAGFFMCIAGLHDEGTPKFDVDKVNDGFGERWYIRDTRTMTIEEHEARFREQATMAGIAEDKQDRVIEIVNNLEEQDDMSTLISNLVL